MWAHESRPRRDIDMLLDGADKSDFRQCAVHMGQRGTFVKNVDVYPFRARENNVPTSASPPELVETW
ncbi:unnamed protein product [Dovyalis caffra]|uniref:Uncharacterized protein n=1 Tax=Dovyalis caffra TaxID=77055 RepID=A0AAV1SB05_9ROSI|nr:unnamed protein product [Dovyalis caffra]